MSHIVQIQTEVRDPAAIAAACQRLQLPTPVFGAAKLFSESKTGWKGQGEVWEAVGTVNASIGNEDEGGDFAAAYLDKRVVGELKPYVEKLEPIGRADQIVGVAASINGEMVSVDIFESTPLFRKFWPKLLKSHSLDAASAASESDDAKVAKENTVEDCVAFLKSMQESEGTKEEKAGGQHIVRRESENGICFSYHDAVALSERESRAVSAAGGIGVGLGGGLGGAVHSGGFAK